MYQLKGFVTIKDLVNNAVGMTAPIGELSLWSQTYTKERGEYENVACPGFRLASIYSLDTVTGIIPLNKPLADRVLVISKWVFDFLKSAQQPLPEGEFANEILAMFPSEISYFNFGNLIDDGVNIMPEWISWKDLLFPDNEIRVWFSDEAFAAQFDLTEIVTVAPLLNLDEFFLAPNLLKSKIFARSATETMNIIQETKGNNPETILRTETFDYKSPDQTFASFPTNWTVLIYGAAGDNPDTIKDAIISYILENSTHTRAEWSVILPDLFKRTEFMLNPAWYSYAIPNKTVQAGIYSPIVHPKEALFFAKTIITEYDPVHIENVISYFNHPYKAISIGCVGSIENRDNKVIINDFFPDYINVGTHSTDFNRMALSTQNWALLLEELLITAESMTEFSTIPRNMRRMHRGGYLYVSAVFENVQYLVSAKENIRILNNYVDAGYVIPDMFRTLFTQE